MLPPWLARFNRAITNRTYGRLAGRAPWLGQVVHRGRRTGRVYRTPVNIHRFEGGYRISIDYGRHSDWVQNVLAQGGCVLVDRGKAIALTTPRVIHDPQATWAPLAARRVLARIGSGYYMEMREL